MALLGPKLLLGKVGLFLAANPMFKAALVSWALAESIKLLLSLLVERKWDFWSRRMPSPLAALWTGLTISVAACYREPGPDPDRLLLSEKCARNLSRISKIKR